MKPIIYKFLAVGLTLFSLSSCDENVWESELKEGNGVVELKSLTIDVDDRENIVKRLPTRATYDLSNFIITVTDKNLGKVVGQWVYEDMPEVLTLPVNDKYNIKVESHKINLAEWDRPYYCGNKDFEIEQSKITRIGDVSAKFESLKVTIKFADDLRAVMGDDVKVTVKGTNGSELVYTPDNNKIGYFAIDGSNTFAAHFEGTVGGVKTESATPFKNIAKGQHHILTYSAKSGPEIPEQSGSIDSSSGVELDLEYEVDEVGSDMQIEEDIINSDDRPGQEETEDDPGNEEDPQPGPGGDDPEPDGNSDIEFEAYDSPNLDLEGINIASNDFGNAIIRINCKNGIKKFVVEIGSDDEDGFGQAIKDLGLTSFDLTDPDETQERNLKELNLPYGESVLNQNQVDFDITGFVPLLLAYQGQYTTSHTHTFTMTVTDNNGETSVLNLRFLVEKP